MPFGNLVLTSEMRERLRRLAETPPLPRGHSSSYPPPGKARPVPADPKTPAVTPVPAPSPVPAPAGPAFVRLAHRGPDGAAREFWVRLDQVVAFGRSPVDDTDRVVLGCGDSFLLADPADVALLREVMATAGGCAFLTRPAADGGKP